MINEIIHSDCLSGTREKCNEQRFAATRSF